ncbi:MAG: hypothetical protein HYR55_10570 [Acidobacteria bacterium]|nr:hypothetical protein [Acidobacteriota bacterium]MBI3654920.1 hypothetical protein [Acidobacteriota bacterium]
MLVKFRTMSRFKDIVAVLAEYGLDEILERLGLVPYIGRLARNFRRRARAPRAESTAARLRMALERLGPTFIKLGQMLSTQVGFLPPEYIHEIERLQDKVAPIDYQLIAAVLEAEFGKPPTEIFRDIDEQAMASASMAQVHRATLKDGTAVVVKVQRPNVEKLINEDLEILSDIALFVGEHSKLGTKYDFLAMVDQLKRAISDEVDFRLEARNSALVAASIAEYDRLCVPPVHKELTTKRVLVADYVEGPTLTHAGATGELTDEERKNLARQLLEAYIKQVMIDGFFHCDPHPGNVILMPDHRLALIDFGQIARLDGWMQDQFLQFLLNLASNRGDRVADICMEIGMPKPGLREARLHHEVAALVARYHNVPLGDLHIGRSVMQLIQTCANEGLQIPGEVALLGKTMINLDAVGRTLDPEFNPFDVIRNYAQHVVLAQIGQRFSKGSIYSTSIDFRRLLADLPYQARLFFSRLSTHRMRLDIHVQGQEQMTGALRKIANRIALSLIVAALIIGSSNLFTVNVGPKLWGFPIFALVGFLAAVSLGIHLILGMLFGDRR